MAKKQEAYILVIPGSTMSGVNRLVEWNRGHGVWSMLALASARFDLCRNVQGTDDFEFISHGEEAFAGVLKYWKDAGAIATPCTPAEAMAYSRKMFRGEHIEKPKAKPKAKSKAKTKDKPAETSGATAPHKKG